MASFLIIFIIGLVFTIILHTASSLGICSTQTVKAVSHNLMKPFEVLIFTKDYLYTYDLDSKQMSKPKSWRNIWEAVTGDLMAVDSAYLTERTGTHFYSMLFINNQNQVWTYECRINIQNCRLIRPEDKANVHFKFSPVSAFVYQKEMPRRDVHSIVHLYGDKPNKESDCRYNLILTHEGKKDVSEGEDDDAEHKIPRPRRQSKPTNDRLECFIEKGIEFENLLKIQSTIDSEIRGITAYHWQSVNITDFFIVGQETVRFTFLGDKHEFHIKDFFGCWSLTSVFHYAFVGLGVFSAVLLLGIIYAKCKLKLDIRKAKSLSHGHSESKIASQLKSKGSKDKALSSVLSIKSSAKI